MDKADVKRVLNDLLEERQHKIAVTRAKGLRSPFIKATLNTYTLQAEALKLLANSINWGSLEGKVIRALSEPVKPAVGRWGAGEGQSERRSKPVPYEG
jgi:hypothetical protein